MSPPLRARRLAMVIDAARCLHCAACVVACKAENEVGEGHSRNWLTERAFGTFPALRVVMTPSQCMHCDDAPCVRVCPTGASYRDASGVVLVDSDDCIGCRYCIEACPYAARYFDEASGTVDKCTFCLPRVAAGREPACVETCPTKTRIFGDMADPREEISRVVAQAAVDVALPQAGTSPKVYYLRGDR
jgi:tetrathionate reductase subunit B